MCPQLPPCTCFLNSFKASLLIRGKSLNSSHKNGREAARLAFKAAQAGSVRILTMISFLPTDMSCFQMNDSSYDSLENELNEDADAPCSDLVKKLGQGSRSMDSVLTLSDYDLEQPEVEGLLTLSNFDLDQSKDEHIQIKPPLEPKPVNVFVAYRKVSLGEQARAPDVLGTPSCLPAAAADAPKVLRQHRRSSEPSIDYLDTKLSYLREFYQKKLRKSSCDAVLSRKDEDYLKQTQPRKKGDKMYFKQSSVTGTDISKRNTANENIKKKSLSGHEGNQVTPFPKSKPVAISVASYSHVSCQDHPRKQPFDADTCRFSPPHIADAQKSSRVHHRRCSEPSIDDQHYKLSYLRGIYSKKQSKTSCEAGLLHGEEDYLKRHKSLQIEGQKLINQSLVMGIEVGKSSSMHQSSEKVLPPRLNLCPRASYSSLSSPGTSPSGSSVSSQDSAFSQISEHSVFTPTETSSPIDCTFQTQRKQEELSSDFDSPSLLSGMPGPSAGQASSHLAYLRKGTPEQPSQMHSVTLHPSTWLRSGLVTLKNWSLKKKTKAARPEDRKVCSLKEPLDLPSCASGTPEADSLQESQDDIHLRVDEGPGQTACGFSSYACQDSEKHTSSPFHLAESRLKLCMKLHEGEESGGQYPFGNPWEGASSSLETSDDMANPDAEPSTVLDDGDRHLTKDHYVQ